MLVVLFLTKRVQNYSLFANWPNFSALFFVWRRFFAFFGLFFGCGDVIWLFFESLASPKVGGSSGMQNQIRASFVLYSARFALPLQAECNFR